MAQRFLEGGRLGRIWVTRLMPGDELVEGILETARKAGVPRAVILCGPPPMMRLVRQALARLGVPPSHIRFEEFRLK